MCVSVFMLSSDIATLEETIKGLEDCHKQMHKALLKAYHQVKLGSAAPTYPHPNTTNFVCYDARMLESYQGIGLYPWSLCWPWKEEDCTTT